MLILEYEQWKNWGEVYNFEQYNLSTFPVWKNIFWKKLRYSLALHIFS